MSMEGIVGGYLDYKKSSINSHQKKIIPIEIKNIKVVSITTSFTRYNKIHVSKKRKKQYEI